MTVFTFTVVLDRRPTAAELDELFDADCDDAVFGVEENLPIAEFDRDAPTMADAIASAVRSLEHHGLKALRVVDQDLVTLADIGQRIGQSRESVRRYASGQRGSGGFPPPVNPARDGTVFYRWSEVAPWIRSRLGVEIPDIDPALIVANLVLQARQHSRGVEHLSVLRDLLTDQRLSA